MTAIRKALYTRCPECGDPVQNFFDHVDRDCTGQHPDKVAAGQLYPPLSPARRRAEIAKVTGGK